MFSKSVSGYGPVQNQSEVLDFCEICAGSGRMSKYMNELGMSVGRMDVAYSRHMDLLTSIGFIVAMNMIRRIRRAGHAPRLALES